VIIEQVQFPNRQDRTRYLSKRYSDFLKGRILDVGCDQGVLRNLMAGIDYVGIDFQGNPDIRLNLEKSIRLPFKDRSFDCVLCIDVLEHLDNLYEMFDELIRVSNRYIIVALPNCWCGARKPIDRGKGSFAHYGLPPEKPADRHKWFFSLSEARTFIEARVKKGGITIGDIHATEKPRPAIVTYARRLRYPNLESYANRYVQSLWVRLDKMDL